MTRLIDADALKAVFEEKSSEAVCGVELCKAIISRIDEAPTVDAVPVVRCKDCADFCKGKCDNLLGLPNPYPDSFCSFGKRRGDA